MPWLAKNCRQLSTHSLARSSAPSVSAAGVAQSISISTRAPDAGGLSRADDVAGLNGIRRIVSARHGQVGLVAVLEADLMLDTPDRLDAALSIRTLTASDPKLRFST